jgi:retron-type reverse transcriptase
MIEALIAGERDPRLLANLARGTMRNKIPDLAMACAGRFADHHALLARMHLDHVDHLTSRPVRAVETPKDHGAGVRVLGVPNTVDRIAQTAAAMLLELKLEPIFHPDSYGYRLGRTAHDALAVARRRCWRKDWVLDIDVRAFLHASSHCSFR